MNVLRKNNMSESQSQPKPASTTQPTTPNFAERLDELEVLIRQNIQWNQLVYQESKRTRRRLTIMAIGDWMRILFWLIPIGLGFIFIPPLVRQVEKMYQDTVVRPQQKFENNITHVLDTVKNLKQTVSSTLPH
jgi:hypothetical protein